MAGSAADNCYDLNLTNKYQSDQIISADSNHNNIKSKNINVNFKDYTDTHCETVNVNDSNHYLSAPLSNPIPTSLVKNPQPRSQALKQKPLSGVALPKTASAWEELNAFFHASPLFNSQLESFLTWIWLRVSLIRLSTPISKIDMELLLEDVDPIIRGEAILRINIRAGPGAEFGES